MWHLIEQIVFVLTLALIGWAVYRRIRRITDNVYLGKPWQPEDVPAAERWRLVGLFALGQKKMFDKPLVAIMHLVIYVGFFVINIEILEILLDGILGTHRLFAPFIPGVYPWLINIFEWLAFGVLAVCVVFLIRRNGWPIKRFHARELRGWPRRDGNLILTWEIALMVFFLTWNASETVLRERASAGLTVAQVEVPVPEGVGDDAHTVTVSQSTGDLAHYQVAGLGDRPFVISGALKPLFEGWGTTALIAYERAAWWLHIVGILLFALYVTYSKHLHIGMAFPTIYWGRTRPQGQMRNMPDIQITVAEMMGLPVPTVEVAKDASVTSQSAVSGTAAETPPEGPGRFGARDVTDLSRKSLIEAYACTECGRCTAACPANITGKLLSPRWIMMATRDRMEEIGAALEKDPAATPSDKTLLDHYITREELLACTTCNACVTACPVNINPLEIILELRRYAVLEESNAPQSWNAMFQNMENSQAPWAYPPSERLAWIEKS